MAIVTSAAVAIPSFTGLKASGATMTRAAATVKTVTAPAPRLVAKAALKDVGVAVVATAASALLASNAMAMEVLLGSSDGGLVFVPSTITIPAGEKITFKNNAGFPHNVVFDEDEVPSGVDVSKISMSEEDLLNAPGEVYSVTLTEKDGEAWWLEHWKGGISSLPLLIPKRLNGDTNMAISRSLLCGHQNTEMNGEVMQRFKQNTSKYRDERRGYGLCS